MNGHQPTEGVDPNHGQTQQLWSRFEETKHNDKVKDALLEDVLTRYDLLLRKHERYVREHQSDHDSARDSLGTATYWHGQAMHLQRILNGNPFIIALIDGDSMLFNSSFLRDGENGGKQAAAVLQSAIAEWATREVTECPEDITVVARVFCNVKGLGDFCTSAGIINSPLLSDGFAHGFTRGSLLFDFVDVGVGRSLTRSKIIDSLEIYIKDYHCRQVLLGCGNDSLYATVLERYLGDNETQQRLTIIEGAPFDDELGALPLRTKKFPGIFHEGKLASLCASDLPRGRVDSRLELDGKGGVVTPRAGSVESYATGPSPLPVRPNGTTWAAITTKNAHKPLIDIARPTSAQPPQDSVLLRNRKGQRLDVELEYDYHEVGRIKKLKACNQHYIGSGCCHYNAGKADCCPHRHDIKFSRQELKWLRVVARETPCKRGHDCVDPDCIYGHHCPFPVATVGSLRGIGCLNGDMCRFPRSMHNMDTAPVKMTKVAGAF